MVGLLKANVIRILCRFYFRFSEYALALERDANPQDLEGNRLLDISLFGTFLMMGLKKH